MGLLNDMRRLRAKMAKLFDWLTTLVVVACLCGLMLTFLLVQVNDPHNIPAESWRAFVIGVAISLVVCGATAWGSLNKSTTKRKLRSEMDNLQRQLDSVLNNNLCRTDGEAVIYLYWDGSIHTFRFYSLVYAEAFADANAGQMLI
jgi:hypothetical protein